MKRKIYKVAGFFDTETCNLGTGCNTRAYVILYIFNRIDCDISCYAGEINDSISYVRDIAEAIEYVKTLVSDFTQSGIVPVMACYNLLFDLKSMMYELSKVYHIEVLAKSTTQPYFVDLYQDDTPVLRFWDMFYLDMRGVSALGDACGLPKLNGTWNYDLIRTPETPLTEKELRYAARDVQVLPMYLKWLVQNNVNIEDYNLANTCLTKTSIVRIDAKRTIGSLKKGNRTLLRKFMYDCLQEQPKCYETYRLRINCFRGGLTFTAGNYAHQLQTNVTSLDVTSMHHAFINGSMIGRGYVYIDDKEHQRRIVDSILFKDMLKVLKYYSQPFEFALNACIVFNNLRLKKRSLFEKACIACLAESRFKRREITGELQEECEGAVFCFSKLIRGEHVKVCITEYELYCISLVYDWDGYEVILLEATSRFREPPEYISLQSNKLYNQKEICKRVLKHKLTAADNIGFMPAGFIQQIETDTLNEDEFNAYYVSTIKGMFNGVYGTQAMNPIRDSYIVDNKGNILIDETKRPNAYNYEKLDADWSRILYTYGARIVGRSRLHLIIAMILLDDALGDKIKILAGDTDSLKIACNNGVSDNDILLALKPLHDAITRALDVVQASNRTNYPDIASSLKDVGCFDIETSENNRYKHHMEYWNKARISIDQNDKIHLTFAGLPSRGYDFGILDVLKAVYNKYGVEVCFNVLGYNVEICQKISNALEHRVPKADEKIQEYVTDYLGNTAYVDTYQTIALYPSCRLIGNTMSLCNRENIAYLSSIGVEVNSYIKTLDYRDGKIIYTDKGKKRFELEV